MARASRILAGASALVVIAAGCAPGAREAEGPVLREADWVAGEADLVAALSRRPTECLSAAPDADEARRVEIGRAAFRTELLLGNQAARAGLTCASCHRAGRGNAVFHFEGVSGEAGTADVTSSFFSTLRGDATVNPVPIPDLSGPPQALRVSQSAPGELETFIRGLVVEEFDGPEPPPAVLDGLAAYVRALGPEACPAEAEEALVAQAHVDDALRAARAGAAALEEGDAETAALMLAAARSALGLLHERFAGARLGAARDALVAAGLSLGQARVTAMEGDLEGARTAVETWLAAAPEWIALVEAGERRSLYDQRRLARAVAVADAG